MSRSSDRDDRDESVEEQRGDPVDRPQSGSASPGSAASANGEYSADQGENHAGTDRESPQPLYVSHERPTLPSRSRQRVNVRGRTIHISAAERVLMTEIGTFRTLAVSDLVQYRYGNDPAKLRQDLVNLKAQNLVRQRRVMAGRGREKFSVLTLTKQGKHFLQKESAGPSGQIFYADFVKPHKKFRAAAPEERPALQALDTMLGQAPEGASAEDLQNIVYEAGKSNGYTKETLRSWFQAIYEVLLGSSQGPRFGSFVALYGVAETRALIEKGLSGKLLTA